MIERFPRIRLPEAGNLWFETKPRKWCLLENLEGRLQMAPLMAGFYQPLSSNILVSMFCKP